MQSGELKSWSGHFANGELTGKGEYRGNDGRHYRDFRRWRYNFKGKLSLAGAGLSGPVRQWSIRPAKAPSPRQPAEPGVMAS